MIDPRLKDKVVLVTGGNNPLGIGAATARAFAAQGARVFITYKRQPPEAFGVDPEAARRATVPGDALARAHNNRPATEVVETIRAQGGQVAAEEVDLADPATIPPLFDRVEATFGPVQILVNNAAHSLGDTFLPGRSLEQADRTLAGKGVLTETVTAESHDRHFAVNSRAVALLIAEFARRHLAREGQWGRIINISTDGAAGFAGEISYGASKRALESYSQAAARELAPYGITVNVLSLGPIQTGWMSPELEAEIAGEIPLGRIGQPEDIADMMLLVASEQARWLTGQHLHVGGGAKMPL